MASSCPRAQRRVVLEPFFAALDKCGQAPARVVVLGNSLIASDGIVSVLRARLVERFGDGGRGLVLADRMASYGPRDRTAAVSRGWRAETCADDLPESAPLGLAGVQHISDGPAWSRFLVNGERTASVFWLPEPARPPVEWRVDDEPWTPLQPSHEGPSGIVQLPLPPSTERFELRTRGPGAVVQGVALEKDARGVVVDTMGVPAADATRWVQTDQRVFSAQLAARSPALTVIMLGGNEVKRHSGKKSATRIESDLRELILRTRAATSTACLVVGPIDAVKPKEGEAFVARPGLMDVVGIERRVALEEGCAFFDMLQAMGGRGSLKRLHAAGALHTDFVHPKKLGLDLLGQLLADALLQAYATSSPVVVDRFAARAP